MGWVIDFILEWFWAGFVMQVGKGKPWWVHVLLALSPIIVLAILVGALYLAFEGWPA